MVKTLHTNCHKRIRRAKKPHENLGTACHLGDLFQLSINSGIETMALYAYCNKQLSKYMRIFPMTSCHRWAQAKCLLLVE